MNIGHCSPRLRTAAIYTLLQYTCVINDLHVNVHVQLYIYLQLSSDQFVILSLLLVAYSCQAAKQVQIYKFLGQKMANHEDHLT